MRGRASSRAIAAVFFVPADWILRMWRGTISEESDHGSGSAEPDDRTDVEQHRVSTQRGQAPDPARVTLAELLATSTVRSSSDTPTHSAKPRLLENQALRRDLEHNDTAARRTQQEPSHIRVTLAELLATTELRRGTRIRGLDASRGVAVILVVWFHLWPGTLPGGFVGVSWFFALSGYLITGNLLAEQARDGRISIGQFWSKRVRRLLPAAWAAIGGVVVVWSIAGWLTEKIRIEAVMAAVNLTNWAEIAARGRYGTDDTLAPFAQFWSLAIEEQFYLVYPLIVAACTWGVPSRFTAKLTIVLCGLVAVSAMTTVWAAGDAGVVYYSSLTRFGEIAAGAIGAVAVHTARRRQSGNHIASTRAHMKGLADFIGALGIAALVALAAISSLDNDLYYRGGLLAVGVLSAVTVVAVARSRWLGIQLDRTPLAWVGARSYGIYLFHWTFLVLAVNLGHTGAPALIVVAAATVLVAAVSYRWLEQPIRLRHRVTRRPALIGFVAAAALTATFVWIPTEPNPMAVNFESLAASDATATRTSSQPVQAESLERTVRYALFGDSKAFTLSMGGTGVVFGQDVDATIDPPLSFDRSASWLKIGCPLGRGGRVRLAGRDGSGADVFSKCGDWEDQGIKGPLDVAIAYFGTWDVAERRVEGLSCGWCSLDDPAYDSWLRTEMSAFADHLFSEGVGHVAFVTLVYNPDGGHPGRTERYNEIIGELAAARPTLVHVIDLAGWLSESGRREQFLPDYMHFTFDENSNTAAEIMEQFLAEQIMRIGTRSG